jgi:hypothetical protein
VAENDSGGSGKRLIEEGRRYRLLEIVSLPGKLVKKERTMGYFGPREGGERERSSIRWTAAGFLVFFCLVWCITFPSAINAEEGSQRTFSSPEDALNSLVRAAAVNDTNELLLIFGPSGKGLVVTGNEKEDSEDRARFVSASKELRRVAYAGEDRAVLHFGKNDWPLAIPVVKRGEVWIFDTPAGKEEIINRRIGRNELNALGVCREYVKAQQEYAESDHDNDGVLEYAQRIRSTPGSQDGLFWEAKEGEENSPFGPLIAGAARAEVAKKKDEMKPVPYHGYYFKVLKKQGKHAVGGAYQYVIHGNMVAGYALLAYPADYGITGIMTFVVNQNGIVYQKDLGSKTENKAKNIKRFNPDNTWKPQELSILPET